jgi:peptidoglycan/xylan/chitin deacetylase (PgdA/CDA1 family)
MTELAEHITFRDDDIGYDTILSELVEAHSFFIKHGVTHTVAVEAFGMDTAQAKPIVKYLKSAEGFDIQLHCLTHVNLAEDIDRTYKELTAALRIMTKVFSRKPTILYPPWNKSSPELEKAAATLGLEVSWEKISLEAYIRCNGGVAEPVVNFHYWEPTERAMLDRALTIFTYHRARHNEAHRLRTSRRIV